MGAKVTAAKAEPASPGPARLWMVRHGQSAGNVARDAAELGGLDAVALATRDIDVDLTELGERQAGAVATWLLEAGDDARPTIILSSPYRRARRTAGIIAGRLRLRDYPEPILDERLRERELGVLDHLTRTGIETRHPDEAARMTALGKFYHRPPGGESWCDVILRVRSWFDTVCREFPDERIVVVTHGVVLMCISYLLERLDEPTLLGLAADNAIVNCGVTGYARVAGSTKPAGLERTCFNLVAPLAEAGEPVTATPDRPRQTAP